MNEPQRIDDERPARQPAPSRLDQALVERARSVVPLASLVGKRVKLRRSGRDWAGLCPFHQEKSPSFNVVESKGFYHCFGCGAHGSAIDWMMEVEGLGFRAAVEALLGGELPDARRSVQVAQRPAAERRVEVVSSRTAGAWIWRNSTPARGEIVEAYLASRGLDPAAEFLPGAAAIDEVAFHPRCPLGLWRIGEDPNDVFRTAPAMMVPIRDSEGLVWGVRVTWLAADGSGEAALPRLPDGRERPKRKIFGQYKRLAAFLTPVTALDADAPLIVGEGFETAWAFAQGFGKPCRVAAALSLENLQGGAVKIGGGALPLWRIRADPERAPFVLSDAGEVIVLVDADMKPLKQQKVQLARGAKPVVADIAGIERARICAELAAQAWRRAGAAAVRCVRPRMGFDFNDVVGATSEKPKDFNDALRSEAA